jgi:hypothetical protein
LASELLCQVTEAIASEVRSFLLFIHFGHAREAARRVELTVPFTFVYEFIERVQLVFHKLRVESVL